jgi:Tat protein secretion system quality control protein TatD with DNase activity
MEESTSKTLLDFDGQVITDYFQSLVNSKQIESMCLFEQKEKSTHIKYSWHLVIKKRWSYKCVIVLHSADVRRDSVEVTSLSRRCKIVLHRHESIVMLKGCVKNAIQSVLRGVNAEKFVMNVINNELVLKNNGSFHCFPTSEKDDKNGADLSVYYKENPSSIAVRIQIQVTRDSMESEKVVNHLIKYPNIPILVFKEDSEYIKDRVIEIFNDYFEKEQSTGM